MNMRDRFSILGSGFYISKSVRVIGLLVFFCFFFYRAPKSRLWATTSFSRRFWPNIAGTVYARTRYISVYTRVHQIACSHQIPVFICILLTHTAIMSEVILVVQHLKFWVLQGLRINGGDFWLETLYNYPYWLPTFYSCYWCVCVRSKNFFIIKKKKCFIKSNDNWKRCGKWFFYKCAIRSVHERALLLFKLSNKTKN